MFEVFCVVSRGNSPHGNDDRAVVNGHIITEGEYKTTAESVLAVVCDGVSGEKFGDLAAEMAVRYFSELPPVIPEEEELKTHIRNINDNIFSEQKKEKLKDSMSTTIAGLYLEGESYMAFNIGDSSIFRFRMSYLAKLSEDHTLSKELEEIGMTPKEYQKNIITRSLGGSVNVLPYIDNGKGRLFDEDVFIICSDGITDFIDGEELEQIVSENDSTEDICRTLVNTALDNGSCDNISVIAIRRV